MTPPSAPSVRQWAEHAVNVTITLGCAFAGGVVLVTPHPELAGEPTLRILLSVFALLMAGLGLRAAIDSWLRLHGLDRIEIEFGLVDRDDGGEMDV